MSEAREGQPGERVGLAILEDLLATLPDGRVERVALGSRWTAVLAQVGGEIRCGMAATLARRAQAGVAEELEGRPARQLAERVLSQEPFWASLGMATVNALLSKAPGRWPERSAKHLLREVSRGKRLVMVGHFPFADELRGVPAEFHILEKRPRPGDLPESAAPDVLPEAEVVALTGMTLTNHTLEGLLELCNPQAFVILIGPSTPLSPVLFDYGVDILCGAVVLDNEAVLAALEAGASFRRIRPLGVKLVGLRREHFEAGG
jgi:hypothetical protein